MCVKNKLETYCSASIGYKPVKSKNFSVKNICVPKASPMTDFPN